MLLAAPLLSGCKVVSLEADKQRREQHSTAFDASSYVKGIWAAKVLPNLQKNAVPLPLLVAVIRANLANAGAKYGRRSGEGALWSFTASADGQITAVDRRLREGRASLTCSTHDAAAVPVEMQIGPVVSGDAIRDALPFITFNDFPDQIAFADVSRAMTERAMTAMKQQLSQLKVGERVHLLGVFSLAHQDETITITPVLLEAAADPAGSVP